MCVIVLDCWPRHWPWPHHRPWSRHQTSVLLLGLCDLAFLLEEWCLRDLCDNLDDCCESLVFWPYALAWDMLMFSSWQWPFFYHHPPFRLRSGSDVFEDILDYFAFSIDRKLFTTDKTHCGVPGLRKWDRNYPFKILRRNKYPRNFIRRTIHEANQEVDRRTRSSRRSLRCTLGTHPNWLEDCRTLINHTSL